MKKIILSILGILLFFNACNSDWEEIQADNDYVQDIRINAPHLKFDSNSRTDFEFSETYVGFKWADGDTIGIFPNEGYQVAFEIKPKEEESDKASFTGGGWGLKSTNTYASYYPFIGKMYLDKNKIPVTYLGQKQVGKSKDSNPSCTSHLGKYDYMVAPQSSVNASGGVSLDFVHLGSLVILNLTIPTPTTLQSVTLTNNGTQWTTKGYYDLMASAPSIQYTEKSYSMTIDLDNITTTQDNEIVTIYFWAAPVNLQYNNITAKVETTDGNIYARFNGKNLQAGQAYALNATDFVDESTYNSTFHAYTISEEPSQDANGVYLIKSASNMKWFMENAGSYYYNKSSYKLMTDIILENISWEPIHFYGVFDGGNHIVENLSPSGYEKGGYGFFRTMYGTVKNLILKNPQIQQTGDNEYYGMHSGILAAEACGSIINCGVIGGSISISSTSRAQADGGGLVGQLLDGAIMKGCYVIGTKVKGNYWANRTCVGGLVGCAYSGNITITSCYTKDVTVTGNSGCVIGAFIGHTLSSKFTINTCFYENSGNAVGASYSSDNITANIFEALTEENLSQSITKMNANLTDCDYIFGEDGFFVKRL